MTVNSLINFGVPGLTGQHAAPLQPILRNKFRIIFTKFGETDDDTYIMTQQVRAVTLPEFHREQTCPPICIEFLDDVTTGALGKVLGQCVRQRDHNEVDSYFSMRIELLAGGVAASGPDVLRTYTFDNCIIKSLQSNNLDYSSNDPALQFSVKVSYGFLHIHDAEMKRLW